MFSGVKSSTKTLIVLHFVLVVYSITGILGKIASTKDFFSFEFCAYYLGIIFLLGVYAIAWQQIIKRLPLTTAFANKAITVVWGIVWGFLFFGESINALKVAGALLVVAGAVVYARSDGASGQDAGDMSNE